MKQFYKNTPVLITGGCGFIGSHVAQKLVECGAKVTIMDNLSTGSLDNIKNIKQDITFLKKDITNFDDCLAATKNKKIIFHLAAFISVPESVINPMACHYINVQGTVNLLEAARINTVEKFIFSSSAAVYGPTENTCVEDMPCKPTSPYGFSKLMGELYCNQYAHNFGLHTIILRYFNVYGTQQNPNGQYAAVVAKFSDAIKHNKPITIFGDGTQTRDFIPVEHVADANVFVATTTKNATCGQIFNVATGKSMSLLELVDKLKQDHPHYTGSIELKENRTGDIKHSTANVEKFNTIQKPYAKKPRASSL